MRLLTDGFIRHPVPPVIRAHTLLVPAESFLPNGCNVSPAANPGPVYPAGKPVPSRTAPSPCAMLC